MTETQIKLEGILQYYTDNLTTLRCYFIIVTLKS